METTTTSDTTDTGMSTGFNFTGIVPPSDMDCFMRMYMLSHVLLLYISPFIFICGTICNILSFSVLHTPFFRSTACGFLLKVLAVVDTGCLNSGLLRKWILEIPSLDRLDIRSYGVAACKLHSYFTSLFPQLSSWTLGLVSVDRAVAVAFPLSSRVIWTKSRVTIIWAAIFVVLAILNVLHLTFQDLQVYRQGDFVVKYCNPTPDYLKFMKTVWPWVDFIVVDAIPCLVIICSNIVITYHLVKSNRHRERTTLGVQNFKQLQSTTAMLIALSVFFLITVTPRCAYLFILVTAKGENTCQKATQNAIYACVYLIYSLNNAANFALYCCSGSKFRIAAYNLFTCRRLPMEAGSVTGSNSNLRSRVIIR